MKKQLLILILYLPCAVFYSSAQITFQKTFGGIDEDKGHSVQQTMDGGYIISGSTESFAISASDAYLIKTNAYGDTMWTRTFSRIGYEIGYSVQQTADTGYIICGSSGGSIYLIKTGANGNWLWSKALGIGAGASVEQTSDGGYIITGTIDNGINDNDFYLIKADMNGDVVWSKKFGGNNSDNGFSGQQTTDGGYILAGNTSSFSDVCIIKTDSLGDTLWTRTYGGANLDWGYAVQQTTDGGYIITGLTGSFGAGDKDVYLIKTDTIGNLLWSKTFGGTYFDVGYDVRQTTDGGYIILGSTTSWGGDDLYLIKTDANGDTLWTKAFGGTAFTFYGESIQQTTDGGYIITGYGHNTGALYDDVLLIKTDANGNSGCNEVITATITSAPLTQITNNIINVYSGVGGSSTSTTVYSGAITTTLCSAVGVNEISTAHAFFVSPNPTQGNFVIAFEGTITKGNIAIINILGESIFTGNISNESKREINLKNISSGIYFIKVFDGEKSYCKKLIVE
ncbi:MAG: T9SS type A sorting domain-containing protein [Bacteroidia bacterium]